MPPQRYACDAVETFAQVIDLRHAARIRRQLEQAAGQVAGQLSELLLELQPRNRLGNLPHRPFIVERLAGLLVVHDAGGFGDPDPLSRLVPEYLRNEVLDITVLVEDFAELIPAGRINVPFCRDVAHRGEHLFFFFVAVQLHQGAVGADLAAVDRRTVYALGQMFDEFAGVVVLIHGFAVEPPVAPGECTRQGDRQDRQQDRAIVTA